MRCEPVHLTIAGRHHDGVLREIVEHRVRYVNFHRLSGLYGNDPDGWPEWLQPRHFDPDARASEWERSAAALARLEGHPVRSGHQRPTGEELLDHVRAHAPELLAMTGDPDALVLAMQSCVTSRSSVRHLVPTRRRHQLEVRVPDAVGRDVVLAAGGRVTRTRLPLPAKIDGGLGYHAPGCSFIPRAPLTSVIVPSRTHRLALLDAEVLDERLSASAATGHVAREWVLTTRHFLADGQPTGRPEHGLVGPGEPRHTEAIIYADGDMTEKGWIDGQPVQTVYRRATGDELRPLLREVDGRFHRPEAGRERERLLRASAQLDEISPLRIEWTSTLDPDVPLGETQTAVDGPARSLLSEALRVVSLPRPLADEVGADWAWEHVHEPGDDVTIEHAHGAPAGERGWLVLRDDDVERLLARVQATRTTGDMARPDDSFAVAGAPTLYHRLNPAKASTHDRLLNNWRTVLLSGGLMSGVWRRRSGIRIVTGMSRREVIDGLDAFVPCRFGSIPAGSAPIIVEIDPRAWTTRALCATTEAEIDETMQALGGSRWQPADPEAVARWLADHDEGGCWLPDHVPTGAWRGVWVREDALLADGSPLSVHVQETLEEAGLGCAVRVYAHEDEIGAS